MRFYFGLIILAGLVLGGCGQTTANNNQQEIINQAIVEKTGEIKTKSGDNYLLNTNDGIVDITSNKVNLDDYINKKITVKGMFSGSTLYIDSVTTN